MTLNDIVKMIEEAGEFKYERLTTSKNTIILAGFPLQDLKTYIEMVPTRSKILYVLGEDGPMQYCTSPGPELYDIQLQLRKIQEAFAAKIKVGNYYHNIAVVKDTLASLRDLREDALEGHIGEKCLGICGIITIGMKNRDEVYTLLQTSFGFLELDMISPLGELKRNNWKGKRLLKRLTLMNLLEVMWCEALNEPLTCWQVDFRFSRLIDPVEWSGMEWKGTPHQRRLLRLGVLHTTRESAMHYANALLLRSMV